MTSILVCPSLFIQHPRDPSSSLPGPNFLFLSPPKKSFCWLNLTWTGSLINARTSLQFCVHSNLWQNLAVNYISINICQVPRGRYFSLCHCHKSQADTKQMNRGKAATLSSGHIEYGSGFDTILMIVSRAFFSSFYFQKERV